MLLALMVSTPTRFSKVLGSGSNLLTLLASPTVDTASPGGRATASSTLTQPAACSLSSDTQSSLF